MRGSKLYLRNFNQYEIGECLLWTRSIKRYSNKFRNYDKSLIKFDPQQLIRKRINMPWRLCKIALISLWSNITKRKRKIVNCEERLMFWDVRKELRNRCLSRCTLILVSWRRRSKIKIRNIPRGRDLLRRLIFISWRWKRNMRSKRKNLMLRLSSCRINWKRRRISEIWLMRLWVKWERNRIRVRLSQVPQSSQILQLYWRNGWVNGYL